MPPNRILPNVHGRIGSLDIVIIPVALVFPEFLLVSSQRPSEDGGV